jgi:dipeptidase D
VKTQDSDHDFDHDPLELFVEDGMIGAKNTSLGADDGLAIAFAMAVLASDDIPHPPIEALFTVDEETGMGGAKAIDLSSCKGRKCLNIDSEIEGVLTVGCAGGYVLDTCIPVNWSEETGTRITVELSGLLGGHSGAEIQKQRGNAHKIMGRVLNALAEDYDFNLISTAGGVAANVIAQFNSAEIIADSAQVDAIISRVSELEQIISAEFMDQEPSLSLKAVAGSEETAKAMDADSTVRVISYLYGAPDGVQCYDRAFPEAVETSLNTGVVSMDDDAVMVKYQIRSSVKSKLDDMRRKLSMWCDLVGASYEISGEYPAWAYVADSELRPLMIGIYHEMFGESVTVETTHGGLECGILFDKKPDLDIVSFGPNLYDVHSVNERADIESTRRSWEYMKEILKACK